MSYIEPTEAMKMADEQSTVNASAVEGSNVPSLVKYPVRYEPMGTCIFDADSNTVLDIRGWGRLQYLPEGEKKQDEIGQFVADAINEKLSVSPLSDSTLREVLGLIREDEEKQSRWDDLTHGINKERQRIREIISKHLERNI